MAKLRPRVAYLMNGGMPLAVRQKLKASQTFKAGDFVVMDANEEIAEISGADTTPIYGLAAENAANVVESGYVMVYPFTDGLVLAVQGSSDPVLANINQSYGFIEDADGIYTLDVTDTTNVVFYVIDIDTNRKEFLVKVIEADRVYG